MKLYLSEKTRNYLREEKSPTLTPSLNGNPDQLQLCFVNFLSCLSDLTIYRQLNCKTCAAVEEKEGGKNKQTKKT